MLWARPIGAVGRAAGFPRPCRFVSVFQSPGLESALAERLFAAYGRAPWPPLGPPSPCCPGGWPKSSGWPGSAAARILVSQRGLAWSGLAVTAGVAGAAWGAWLLFRQGGQLFDAATVGLALMLLFGVIALSWALALQMARMSLRMAFAGSLPEASVEKIVRNPELLITDGERRECAAIWSAACAACPSWAPASATIPPPSHE